MSKQPLRDDHVTIRAVGSPTVDRIDSDSKEQRWGIQRAIEAA